MIPGRATAHTPVSVCKGYTKNEILALFRQSLNKGCMRREAHHTTASSQPARSNFQPVRQRIPKCTGPDVPTVLEDVHVP